MSNPFDNTGPPYPPDPQPGSNAIGKFKIGVSPIGTIQPFQYRSTIISQYANSPTIDALIDDFNLWFDPTRLTDELYDNIINILTAQGYGLDVWGRRVGVNRALQVPTGTWFGFNEAGPTSETFNYGAFYSGQTLTSNFELPDQTYRTLIYAKAKFNITDGSMKDINRILKFMFPHRGNAYVQEGGTTTFWFGFNEAAPTSRTFGEAPFYSGSADARMIMTYNFEFPLSPLELAIVAQSGVLPKPTGVKSSVIIKV